MAFVLVDMGRELVEQMVGPFDLGGAAAPPYPGQCQEAPLRVHGCHPRFTFGTFGCLLFKNLDGKNGWESCSARDE